jgi:two-component system sensor histidine kinase/response regulator
MNAKILLVSDDTRLTETFKKNLSRSGYEVCVAESGKKALQCVAEKFFEIILLDFNLPDKTGIEVTKVIRKLNLESQIIMMTAHANLQIALKAIQEAVYDFLIKPVDFSYLETVIKKALEKLKLEQSIKRLVGELKEKNEKLNYLNEMKSKFLSMASHDLSNTLMAHDLSFEMLVNGLKADSRQLKKIRFIKSGIEQISHLIRDLVDWACIEKGKFHLDKSCFEMNEFVADVIEGSKIRAKTKNIAVSFVPQGRDLMVCADRKRITQVILNLFENAIGHTPAGGDIEISVKLQDDQNLIVAVKDTGCGISPDHISKLFESFYQVESDVLRRGRLGLGLSIAKEIITGHGGKIWAESEGKGKGSVFKFNLPLATD